MNDPVGQGEERKYGSTDRSDPINDPVGQGEERKYWCDQALQMDGALHTRERVLKKRELTLLLLEVPGSFLLLRFIKKKKKLYHLNPVNIIH